MALLSKGRMAKMMLAKLVEIPKGADHIKDLVFFRLGNLVILSTKKDLNEAWKVMKKKAVKEYPEKFILDDREILRWNDGKIKVLDKKISLANYRKLNTLAEQENCTVNQLVNKLIKKYK